MIKAFSSFLGIKEAEPQIMANFAGIKVPVSVEDLLTMPAADTQFNLYCAERDGIKPLSIGEVIRQLPPDQIAKSVLFDTPPSGLLPGNHWRIMGIDEEQGVVHLQMTGIFGNHDYGAVPMVSVPIDKPFFTGVSIQRFEHEGSSLELDEVVQLVVQAGENIEAMPEWSGDTVLWSNNEGVLSERK